MAQTKKISISAMDKIIKDTYEANKTIVWHGQDLVIKHSLSFTEMLKFVDSVVKSCFLQDTGDFTPEIKEFAIRSNLVDMYTNISLPDPLDHQYQLLYQTDIIDTIEENIDEEQYFGMVRAINDKLDHLAKARIEMLQRKLDDAVTSVSGIVSSFESLISGLEAGDLKKFVDAVNDKGFVDEEKIVHLITDKTESSD